MSATELSFEAVVDRYCAAWNEPDAQRRRDVLAAVWSDESVYTDPTVHLAGIEALSDHIAAVATRYPGSCIVRTTVLDAHHRLARFGWKKVLADGKSLPESLDIAELDGSGKLARIVGFFGALAKPVTDEASRG